MNQRGNALGKLVFSRMTIGQLIESLKSKVNTFYLSSESEKEWLNDATPFRDAKVPELEEMLKNAGYQPEGYEMMMSGFTGEMFQMRTFICPTRYQRLKHLVSDKIHSRDRGPIEIMTHQPLRFRRS